MTAASLLQAARTAVDRAERIRLMAETMQHHQAGPEGACTFADLTAAGFTPAEVEVYRDEARALLRAEGDALVREAQELRQRTEVR